MKIENLLDFNSPLTGELSNMQLQFDKKDKNYKPSKYNTAPTNKANNTATNLYYVFRVYAGLPEQQTLTIVSLKKKNCYAVELKNPTTNTTQVAIANYDEKTEEYNFSIGVFDENDNLNTYSLNSYKGTVILCALMPAILAEPEAKHIWEEKSFQTLLKLDASDKAWKISTNLDDFAVYMQVLSDNIYRRMKYPDACDSYGLQVNFRGKINGVDDNIIPLTLAKINSLQVDKILVGNPEKIPYKNTSLEDFAGKYSLSQRNFSKEEITAIPALPKWYEMPEYVEKICKNFKATSMFPSPMRTALLIGSAGSGKTEGARAIACGLGLPYDHYTCHDQTEIFDFLGQIFPNGSSMSVKSFDDIRVELGLPNTDDIINDPEYAYKVIMGKDAENPTDADSSTLANEMIRRVMEKSAEIYSNSKDFTYVEGGLIRAIRNGYCFEVQEIGSVKRAGVAVGLNSLLESGDNAFITLPTGEVIKKHKDCCIVFTSNRDYEGCANLNQSVLSRMAMVKRIDTPDADTLIERIKKRLNFPNSAMDYLERMAKVVKHIEEYCKDHDITDGVCGLRELENWAMAVLVAVNADGLELTDELVSLCGEDTVLNKVSQADEYIEEVRTACFDLEFGN